MGGIFGKNKRPCLFPRVVYRAKGKKPAGAPRVLCDASTWTGESHFYSARIGRAPRSLEPPAARLGLGTGESDPEEGTAEPAAPRRARRAETSLPVPAAGDAPGIEVSREPGGEPLPEVMQHQELSEEANQAQPGQSLQESSEAGDVQCPAGSGEDHEVPPLTQTIVQVEVHVSADVQGGPGEAQDATAESELLAGAEQGAGAGCASEEASVGNAHGEVPVQEADGSLGAVEESGLPLKAAESGEGITSGPGSAEGGEAPPDLQLGQDTEVAVTEGVKENAFEAEQAEEMAEVCDHGQASKAGTQAAALQEEEEQEIQVSSGGKPEEH